MATTGKELVVRKVANVTPKLHLLEDHVVEQMRHLGSGLALHGEHGGESLSTTSGTSMKEGSAESQTTLNS